MALNTIATRISLEGAEDVLKQLVDLGNAGERALDQIKKASAETPELSGLSNIIAGIKSAFSSAGEALAPVKARFDELGEAVKGVFENLNKTAEVFGIGLAAGLAGGVAGIAELIKSSAEAGHQLEIQAGVLGLTVEQLQAYRKVAAQAGVDADQLFTALSRLAQNAGKEQEKLTQDVLSLLQGLPLAAEQLGVGVVRGSQTAGAGIKAHLVGNIQEAYDAAQKLAPVLTKALSPDVAKSILPGELLTQLTQAGSAAGAQGEKFRQLTEALSGANIPAQTLGEAFRRLSEQMKDPFQVLGVSLKDFQDAGNNLDPIIRKIIDGIAGIENPAQRAQVGLAVLGRGWREVIAAFDGGSKSLDAAKAALESSGLFLTKEQVETLAEAQKALVALGGAATGLRNQLAVIFAPALTEAAKTFTTLIKENADTLKAWATVIAEQVLPGLSELIKNFAAVPKVTPPGTAPQQPSAPAAGAPGIDTSKLEEAQRKLDEFKLKVVEIQKAFETASAVITPVLNGIAFAINTVFGTNIGAGGAAIILVIGQLSGAFTLLRPLIGLVAAAIAALGSPLIIAAALIAALVNAIVNWRSTLDGLRGALSAVGQGIASDFGTAISTVSGLLSGLSGLIQSFARGIAEKLAPIGSAISGFFQTAVESVAGVVRNIFGEISSFIQGAIQQISGFLNGLLNFVSNIASAVRSLFGAASAGPSGIPGPSDSGGLGLDSGGPGPATVSAADLSGTGFASGGHVSGPRGTDTVPAWLTAGEYVIRVDAVKHYGRSLFEMLNRMALPLDRLQHFSLGGLVDRLSVHPGSAMHFASGGPVLASSADGASHILNLTIGNEHFAGLITPSDVFDKLSRHARSSAVRSAGRKPSWYGA